MYKNASKALQRAHHAGKPHPARGMVGAVTDVGRTLTDVDHALEELLGCMIRRTGLTCEVRKEVLEVAVEEIARLRKLVGLAFQEGRESCSGPYRRKSKQAWKNSYARSVRDSATALERAMETTEENAP